MAGRRVARILLLRHALHDLAGRALAGRMPGLGINAQGREQAQALAAAFEAGGVDALYSSPQQRARETIAPLAQRLGLPVQPAPEFDEIDFGDWTGLGFDEVAQRDPQRWQRWVHRRGSAQPPAGEAFAAVAQRALEGLERLARAHPLGTVLVASHADVIKAAIATVLRMSLDDLERFDIGCARCSEIEVGADWMKVMAVNRLPD